MGDSAFVFAKSETVFHQSSCSLPCFCSGIMIEVEKKTSISQAIPLEPLILMSKNELVGVPGASLK